MTTIIIICLALLIASAIAKSVMDTLTFHFDTSVFALSRKHRSWLDPRVSWKRKYKNGNKEEGERFWGSSRWFVMFTDAWHMTQFVHLSSFFAIAAMLVSTEYPKYAVSVGVCSYFAINLIYGFVFELFFSDALEYREPKN